MHIILKVLLVKEKCGAGCRCAGNLTWRAPEIIDALYRCHCTYAAIRSEGSRSSGSRCTCDLTWHTARNN